MCMLPEVDQRQMSTVVRHADGRVKFVPGPQEMAVRDTLPNRLAGIINNVPNNVSECFAGLFNGCKSRGSLWGENDAYLSIGKAECEWDWRETWGALKTLGLIDWREETVAAPGAKSGRMTWVHLTVTEKGHDVREDDVQWFRQLMDARRQDEAAVEVET